MIRGIIFSVKRFEIHDGPGIRTTLFLKGCPLRCRWCHNPEGLTGEPQTDLRTGKTFGRLVTPEEILPELLADRMFYAPGGVTLSGGEPTLQPEFARAVLSLLKQEGIHTALDSSLYTSRENLESFLPLSDILLIDMKAVDEEIHRTLTGVSNGIILENLRYVDSLGKPYEIRIPLIPGMNDSEIPAMGETLASLKHVDTVRLLGYHDLGRSKYESLGMEYPMGDVKLKSETYEQAFSTLKGFGLKVIHK